MWRRLAAWRSVAWLDADFHPGSWPVSSLRLATNDVHDRITLFNRGANAGGLMVRAGDGHRIASAIAYAYGLEAVPVEEGQTDGE